MKSYTNYEVIFCYKLMFSVKGIKKNIFSYILMALIFLYTIFVINYSIDGINKLKIILYKLIREKQLLRNKKDNKNKNQGLSKVNAEKESSEKKTKKRTQRKSAIQLNSHNNRQSIKNLTINIVNNYPNNPPLKNKKKVGKKNRKISTNTINNNFNPSSLINSDIKNLKLNLNESNPFSPSRSNINNVYKNNITPNKEKNYVKNYLNYIDEEYNRMDFKEAVKKDKRTFCQYYWSLLKKKHLIISTFFSKNDYNILSIKLSLFCLLFALYITLNVVFYSDNILHLIYQDKGQYKLIYQIPITCYSSLISLALSIILKKLSLSQNDIIELKKKQNIGKVVSSTFKIKNCIKNKITIFYIIGFVLLICFWYYVTAFCAVFLNVQISLLKNTIITFIFSMLYPFLLNLFPGIFRMCSISLKSKCCFNFSRFLSII